MLTRNIQNKKNETVKTKKVTREKKKLKKKSPRRLQNFDARHDVVGTIQVAALEPPPPSPTLHFLIIISRKNKRKRVKIEGERNSDQMKLKTVLRRKPRNFKHSRRDSTRFETIVKNKKVPPHRVPSPSLLRASITTAKMISDMSFKPEIPRPNQTRECSHIKAELTTFEIPFKTTFSTSCFYE
jgi:hypothetical protein